MQSFVDHVRSLLAGIGDGEPVVMYPSKAAFLAMVSDPAYQAVAVHRTAAYFALPLTVSRAFTRR